MQIDPLLSFCTKFKSKWIKDLHLKPDTINLIEEKVGKDLKHMITGENFLNRIPVAGLCSKIKNQQMGLNKIAKLLKGKGHCQWNKMATNTLGKDLYLSYIR